GTAAQGNGGRGVYVAFGADGSTIGGTNPADRNLISGNQYNNLRIAASSNNVVQGNLIGTDAAGTTGLGGGVGGGEGSVVITSGSAGETNGQATGNLIGGLVDGARNVISGSSPGIDGLYLGGNAASLTSANLIQGNFIGTDAAGTTALGNGGNGVVIDSGA